MNKSMSVSFLERALNGEVNLEKDGPYGIAFQTRKGIGKKIHVSAYVVDRHERIMRTIYEGRIEAGDKLTITDVSEAFLVKIIN